CRRSVFFGRAHRRYLGSTRGFSRDPLMCRVFRNCRRALRHRLLAAQIVQGMGFSNFEIGVLVALPYAVAGIAQFAWGRHSDRAGERIWHVALPSLLSAFAFALSAALQSQALVLIAIAVAAIGICSTLAPFWAMPPQFLSGKGAAAGIAIINAVGNLGGFIGPYAVGWAKQVTGDYAGGMGILAASLLSASALVLAMGRRSRIALAAP